MYAKHPLYSSFKKDVATLRSQFPDNEWLKKLAENAAQDWHNYHNQKNIVDRLDESLAGCSLWRNIRTAYKLHGNNNY